MTTKYNAQAMLDEVQKEHPSVSEYTLAIFALQRAIEYHGDTKQEFDDFRQAVSDAVEKQAQTVWDIHCRCGTRHPISFNTLEQFIIPKPKPDPLLAALLELELSSDLQEGQHDAKWIRNKLDELGFEIREKNDD